MEKYYKYKFDNSAPKRIIKSEGDFYILSDSSQVKKNLFDTLFVEYNGTVNESIKQPMTNNLKNTGLPMIHTAGLDDDTPIDPVAFHNAAYSYYEQNLEQTKSDPEYNAKLLKEAQRIENERKLNPNGSVFVDQNGHVVGGNYVSPYGSETNQKPKQKTNPMAYDPMFADAKIEGAIHNNTNQTNRPIQTNTNHSVSQENNFKPNVVPIQQHPLHKGIKRKHAHTFVFNIEKMIAEPQFIKFMDSNMEDSLIELFAAEFTNELLRDPSALKQMFIDELETLVYGKKKPRSLKKKKTTKNVESAKSEVLDTKDEIKNDVKDESSDTDVKYDPATGIRLAPVDPRYAHLPPVLEDEDNSDIVMTEYNEDLDDSSQ